MKKIIALSIITLSTLLTACQSLPKPTIPPAPTATSGDKIAFNITGKIGITTQTPDGRQAGSAFYGWGQDGERFAIDLTGALGMGATSISYDGQHATLTNDKGQISADTPEELLLKATGWHAPISQLPYWVMGKVATGDSGIFEDRLIQTTHDEWTADFSYAKNNSLPNHLIITHTDGHRVVMTISHQ